MERTENISLLYQQVGEFVISFQWLESRVREIGWILHDPQRTQWPLTILREETNQVLLGKVSYMFIQAMDGIGSKEASECKVTFQRLISQLHELRKQRNTLLHSAYIELKAGGEVWNIYRANPKIKRQGDEYIVDAEILTPKGMNKIMEETAKLAFSLDLHYTQLIHWSKILPAHL